MSRIVVMGSGETAPTMVKTHRSVLADTFPDGGPSGTALALDTTFGFQDNADELVERTLQYFEQSVGRRVGVARWRRADAPSGEAERTLADLEQARWLFAGPGSPTYALRQWRGTGVAAAMTDVVRRGGTLVVGSAAACTVGSHAVPVYEIYKAGEDLHWAEGLDVLGALAGVPAALVPHFDNAEGGTYDTRYCYLGAARLRAMEALLPDGVGVVGVDEHTALLLDLAAGTATVRGSGVVTLRYRDHEVALADGRTVETGWVGDVVAGRGPAEPGAAPPASTTSASASAPPTTSASTDTAGRPDDAAAPGSATSLRAAVDAERERFDAAMAASDVDAAVAAVHAVEQSMQDWLSDTLQSDDRDHARRVLRAMVVRLGELARTGARDPRDVVGGYVELLLSLRARARADKDFATSDHVRDGLADLGVEVRDTPDGAEWLLPASA
ncbi:CysS/YqeB C-terminal domain-containing protein [Aquipuribacter nitratireducens]|uniref:Cysteinyl-tRNA ligase anticodon binding domain-containing protein n=1 Tax=Aquipuribacter nitratireducens TaxID=650104 RepID=A0ABW0GKN0_9MICO